MDQNNIPITPENSSSWLASCGFIFPTNALELARFDQLYGGIDPGISGAEVDPLQIIHNATVPDKQARTVPLNSRTNKYRLVARKLKPLPFHILEKLNKGNSPGFPDTTSAGK